MYVCGHLYIENWWGPATQPLLIGLFTWLTCYKSQFWGNLLWITKDRCLSKLSISIVIEEHQTDVEWAKNLPFFLRWPYTLDGWQIGGFSCHSSNMYGPSQLSSKGRLLSFNMPREREKSQQQRGMAAAYSPLAIGNTCMLGQAQRACV